MLLEVSKDLKKLDVYATGRELTQVMGHDTYDISADPQFVHSFSDPVLMTDSYKISQLNPTKRDTLSSLYSYKPRVVRYDGVETYWDETHINVWCPSIDTIFFAKNISRILADNSFSHGLEIGTGSGFLSKYVLAKSSEMKSLVINDINLYAIKSADDNIDDPRAEFNLGRGERLLGNTKYDIIFTNPPYIPRPVQMRDNAYEGTGIVEELLRNGHNYITDEGMILLNVSDICWEQTFSIETQLHYEIVDRLRVPLKVNNVLNNAAWLTYLESIGLQKEDRKDYEYWHELRFVVLRKK